MLERTFLRTAFAALGLALCVSGCATQPADLKHADRAAKAGDYATAITEWKTLSEFGYAEAQVKLAQLYIKGKGVPKDVKAGLALLEEARKNGTPAASVELGQLYEKGTGVAKNKKLAESLYAEAAAQNYPRGMMALARFYEREKQPAKALEYYKKAEKLGAAINTDKVEKLKQRVEID